ncbi:metal ABC transporter permease [Planosporangium thailandense]|uniref:Metal ABC transporter permease n=1 Tax=Planosporangium thailandense TaxID=765197 RepID=A0ABX0XWP1_9ACTN|nr:metal ABC transporter permease [Planosporangium thailandense]NJC69589.1 metal ABC transporter permease [Planosporangium thailandense]
MTTSLALADPIGVLTHPFAQHALLAGTAVAAAAGLVGYLLVLRAQVFTADALSHVAFTGALAALAIGLDARLGLFALTVLVALGMGALGHRARPDDVIIGGVFAWILGLGTFFLTVYTTTRSAGNGAAGVTVLFGSIFGLDAARADVTAVIAAAVCAAVLVIARPLLFASLDQAVAAARGVPVRLLGYAFLTLAAVTTAEATQVTGALLILGLLAAPGGAAARLTARPLRAMGLSAGIAVASVWIGLTASYAVPALPPSFAILTVATLGYLGAIIATRTRRRKVKFRLRHS